MTDEITEIPTPTTPSEPPLPPLWKRYISYLWAWRSFMIFLLTPIILTPLFLCFEHDPELRVSHFSMIKTFVYIMLSFLNF